MSELLLINPRKRRKAKRAAPRRAAAKRVTRRRRNPIAAAPAPANPRRRRRIASVRKNNPRRRGKRRSNPIGGLTMATVGKLTGDAAIGAVGALGVDVIYGYARNFLPAAMQSPADAAGAMNPLYFLAKGGIAVLAGVFGRKLFRQSGKMAEGSLTVTMYAAMQSFMPSGVPMGYYSPGVPARLSGHARTSRAAAQLRGNDVGAYVGANGMGAYTGPNARAESYTGEYPYR